MIEVFIENMAGSFKKNNYNEKTFELIESHSLPLPYPYPYGFILGTQGEDGDSVDCYIITEKLLSTGTIAHCEPIGLLEFIEDNEIDHKIIAVLSGQSDEIMQNSILKISDFIYGIFAQHPEMTVKVGSLLSKEEAIRFIHQSQ